MTTNRTYELKDIFICVSDDLYHFATSLDFTRDSFRQPGQKKKMLEGVIVVTTTDFSTRPIKRSTRFYEPNTTEEDFGTENMQLEGFDAQEYVDDESAFKGHFDAIRLAARHFGGFYPEKER